MAEPIAVLHLVDGDVVEIRRQTTTLAVCRKHGRGWTAQVGGVDHQVISLDAVLDLIRPPTRRARKR